MAEPKNTAQDLIDKGISPAPNPNAANIQSLNKSMDQSIKLWDKYVNSDAGSADDLRAQLNNIDLYRNRYKSYGLPYTADVYRTLNNWQGMLHASLNDRIAKQEAAAKQHAKVMTSQQDQNAAMYDVFKNVGNKVKNTVVNNPMVKLATLPDRLIYNGAKKLFNKGQQDQEVIPGGVTTVVNGNPYVDQDHDQDQGQEQNSSSDVSTTTESTNKRRGGGGGSQPTSHGFDSPDNGYRIGGIGDNGVTTVEQAKNASEKQMTAIDDLDVKNKMLALQKESEGARGYKDAEDRNNLTRNSNMKGRRETLANSRLIDALNAKQFPVFLGSTTMGRNLRGDLQSQILRPDVNSADYRQQLRNESYEKQLTENDIARKKAVDDYFVAVHQALANYELGKAKGIDDNVLKVNFQNALENAQTSRNMLMANFNRELDFTYAERKARKAKALADFDKELGNFYTAIVGAGVTADPITNYYSNGVRSIMNDIAAGRISEGEGAQAIAELTGGIVDHVSNAYSTISPNISNSIKTVFKDTPKEAWLAGGLYLLGNLFHSFTGGLGAGLGAAAAAGM